MTVDEVGNLLLLDQQWVIPNRERLSGTVAQKNAPPAIWRFVKMEAGSSFNRMLCPFEMPPTSAA